MFHGKTKEVTTKNFRAFALLFNFTPFSPRVRNQQQDLYCPDARLNGFVYHQDWLQNLMISASLGGFRQHSKTL